MSKGASERVSLELAFLEVLDNIHADVDTSEIAEIHDWSRAVRGKFYGVAVKEALDLSKLKASLPSSLRRLIVANVPGSSSEGVSGIVLGGSSNVASHGSVQYSQMAVPQLIAVCTSESSEAAWSEFVRRFHPFITSVIAKVVRRYRNVSPEVVDDLVQEAFLKLCNDNFRLLKRLATAYDENAFWDFVKVVAALGVTNYFWSAAASKSGSREADHVPLEHVFSPPASSRVESKILLDEIDRILKTLEHNPNFERDYKIFWLHFGQGLTAKAIAALPDVKLSVKGVESTLLRLTRRIRSALTQSKKDSAE